MLYIIHFLHRADADRVVTLVDSGHEFWSLPLQILGALCLLYTQVPTSPPAQFHDGSITLASMRINAMQILISTITRGFAGARRRCSSFLWQGWS